jgi:glycerol-3-phosphate dehydrogenase
LASEALSRDEQIHRLRTEQFDLAVIGGGINGAAVARDAAMRGLRVALIDKGDFAGQTSSRSTKLIHGGLRYLPQGQLRLVYEALRERERLSQITAPHLVRPTPFLFPVYAGRTVPRITLWTGLFLYDVLARTPKQYRHKRLSADSIAAIEPKLGRDGLRGGALYYDCHGDDSRLTLENLLDAILHGAAAANYMELKGFDKREGRIRAAQVTDVSSADDFAIRARIFVNASGPWIDTVRRMDDPGAETSVRLTKGVHLMLKPERVPVRNSLVLSDGQSRIIFLIRNRDSILLGTTDTDYDGEPEHVRAQAADVDYLLDVVSKTIPDAPLNYQDVTTSFAGLRSLVAGNVSKAPSMLPREELILRSSSGMLSIAGGKLTTHRRIAERVMDLVLRELGKPTGKSPTLTTPLPGARPSSQTVPPADSITADARSELAQRYGTRIALLDAMVEQNPWLGQPLGAQCPVMAVEAVFAARFEMARTLEDFMVRRTRLALRNPAQAEAVANRAACLMGSELGWSPERVSVEASRFTAGIKASREF